MYKKTLLGFENFLLKERNNTQIAKNSLFVFILICILNMIGVILFRNLYGTDVLIGSDINLVQEYGIFTFVFYTLLGFFFLAFIEEIVFRLPIALFIRRKIKFEIKLGMIVFLSLIFSVGHMSVEKGIFLPLLLQGTGAMLFSFLFIISGANKGVYIKGLMIVVFVHFLLNILNTLPTIIDDLTKIL